MRWGLLFDPARGLCSSLTEFKEPSSTTVVAIAGEPVWDLGLLLVQLGSSQCINAGLWGLYSLMSRSLAQFLSGTVVRISRHGLHHTVHALLQRTNPVYNYNVNQCGTVHITVSPSTAWHHT